MIDQTQIDEAWEKVSKSNGSMDVLDALKELKYVDEFELTAMLAQQYGMESLDLSGYTIPKEVLDSVEASVVTQYNIIPVMKHDDVLTVAMSDPTDMETIDVLRYLLGCDVEAVVSAQSQIDKVIDQNYKDLVSSVDSFIEEITEDGGFEGISSVSDKAEEEDDDAPIIRLVSLIIIEAYKQKASDIHLEPLEKRYRIRYRIDGVLREVEAPPKYLQANLTSRVKIMAGMDITEKRIPLDGRIQLQIGDSGIDLRVSSIPTTHGESIVMRILDKSSIQLDIPKLGFYADDLEMINNIIGLPDGIFLVTGPTGSGKTTSLYAFLNTINTPNRKIITVEDPIEYQLAGINQVQVNRMIDMTFTVALRAMLRQSPNIIMVGEIRDLETAEIAINAGLTGHLVFSTLHTNDAPGAVTRLIDMGIKPFLVASGVRAIMAQRLLRRACKNCSASYTPTAEEIRLLDMSEEFLAKNKFVKGKGCMECGNSGYKGRVGIYEIFMMSDTISRLIFANEPSGVIRDAARKEGMRSLRDDALRKAAAGTSTLEEVIRITVLDEE
ncbi:MAG: Flp pilus assembly complex ATPase component TadA [Victivallaceae bacterium]|nr:Flp pilus assembly complex ATPase component TadA [Victivallaceae bacterium]